MGIYQTNDDSTNYYEISDLIGKGKFGKVYKGKNKKSKEIRAIKVIEIDDTLNKEYIEREIKNMKVCSDENENSVKYYEHFLYNDKVVIIMELCDKSLQKILDERKNGFSCEEIFNIMNQLNNTFRIMNEKNIIHRDIKLENILVKYKDNKAETNSNINFIVKLTDYGISKQITKTQIGKTKVGTQFTMAPEILEGENVYDSKCDLWSIGIIIYQLFFKEYPYKGTEVAIYNQITKYGKQLLKKTNNSYLDNLINSLLTKDPEKRINYEKYFNHLFFKEYLNKDMDEKKINNEEYSNHHFYISSDNEFAVGLDLGTTFSCIGVYRNEGIEIIPNSKGEKKTPSIVILTNNSNILVGEDTINHLVEYYENCIYEIKRLIGRKITDKEVQKEIVKLPYKVIKAFDESAEIQINVNGILMTYSPVEITSFIIKKMVQNAENYLHQKITKLVITVPAHFNDSQRKLTKQAAELVGLKVLRIINEPTATALAYAFDVNQINETILVFDLG